MMTNDTADTTVKCKPLRVAGLVGGGCLMFVSLGFWFPYLGGSLRHLGTRPSEGPGVTNQDIVRALFGVWLMFWVPGLLITLGAAAGWLRRTCWSLLVLTGAMLLMCGVTAVIGMSSG